MLPESYKLAYAALDAIWRRTPHYSLAILLGGMAINPNDGGSMDPGSLYDWERIAARAKDASQLELILAYLDLDASRYHNVPDDLRDLIEALRQDGTPKRGIVDSVIASWDANAGGTC